MLLAQNPYGRVEGQVQDKSGASVPGAGVRVVNLETNVTTETVSNAEGHYVAANILPGRYRVTAEAKGFKRSERPGLEVRVGDVLRVDVTLEVGEVAESVTVTAETPLLEVSTANLGQVVDRRRRAQRAQ